MQINTGRVFLANDSATVTGNDDVDWSQVLPGQLFIVGDVTYVIATVDAAGDPPTLTLSSKYFGTVYAPGGAGAEYAIVTDFTASYSFPLLNPGDLEAAAIWRRTVAAIDAALSILSAGSTAVPSSVLIDTGSPHTFRVGNVLKRTAGGWALLLSTDSPVTDVPIGVVSEVIDTTHIRIASVGLVANIAFYDGSSTSMVPGRVYYIRSSSLAQPTGGGYCNIADSSSGVWTNVGSNRVPVLVAETATSGVLMTLATALGGTFSTSGAGLVPAPTVDDYDNERLLNAKGLWVGTSVGSNSIDAIHLRDRNTVDWAGFVARTADVDVISHIGDLHTRTQALEGTGQTRTEKAVFFNRVTNPTRIGYFTVPSGVYECYFGFSTPSSGPPNNGTANHIYTELLPFQKRAMPRATCLRVAVVPGDQLRVHTANTEMQPAYLIIKVSVATGSPSNIYQSGFTLALASSVFGADASLLVGSGPTYPSWYSEVAANMANKVIPHPFEAFSSADMVEVGSNTGPHNPIVNYQNYIGTTLKKDLAPAGVMVYYQ